MLNDEDGCHFVYPEAGGQGHQPQAGYASGQQQKEQEGEDAFARGRRRMLRVHFLKLTSLPKLTSPKAYIGDKSPTHWSSVFAVTGFRSAAWAPKSFASARVSGSLPDMAIILSAG
jgi:hypothetical protein